MKRILAAILMLIGTAAARDDSFGITDAGSTWLSVAKSWVLDSISSATSSIEAVIYTLAIIVGIVTLITVFRWGMKRR